MEIFYTQKLSKTEKYHAIYVNTVLSLRAKFDDKIWQDPSDKFSAFYKSLLVKGKTTPAATFWRTLILVVRRMCHSKWNPIVEWQS